MKISKMKNYNFGELRRGFKKDYDRMHVYKIIIKWLFGSESYN